MVFFSIVFLCLFLPLSLIVYYLVPARARRAVLLVESLLFLFCTGIACAVIVLILTALTFAAARAIASLLVKEKRTPARVVLIVMTVFEFGALIFLRSTYLADLTAHFPYPFYLFPLGLSYFVLQSVGCLCDVFRAKNDPPKKFTLFSLYFLFYPRLFVGPVLSPHTAKSLFTDVTFSSETLGRGISRLLTGLSKVLLLAAPLLSLDRTLFLGTSATYSLVSYWLGLLGGVCAFYLLFSGVCDVSIGIAHCYGIRLPESFAPRLYAPTVTQTAESWNKTVVQWFMQFVGAHLPARNALSRTLAFAAMWGLIGLWYSFRLTALLGGIFIGLIISIEYAVDRGASPRRRPIRYIVTLLLLCLIAVFFLREHLSDALDTFRAMAGMGILAPSDADFSLWKTGIVLLIAALYVCSGHWKRVLSRTLYCGKLAFLRTPLTVCALLILFVLDGIVLFTGALPTLPLL